MTASAVPELLIAAGSASQAERYVEAGASAVIVGDSRFGMRLPGSIPARELADAVSRIHARGAKAYVSANRLFRNGELEGLPDYLKAAAEAGADAISFGDPAVLLNAREFAPDVPLHWNPDMIATNSAAANYWGRRGAVRAVLARELNEEEIAGFRGGTSMDIQVQVHGATNIYYSYRNLVQSYMEHLGKEAALVDRGPDKGLYLIETERPDLRFPVYEDESGTHVMSADDICLLEALPDLVSMGVNSLYIEPLLKTESYNMTVLGSYRAALDRLAADGDAYVMDPKWLEAIRQIQDPERELSFGFLYKVQVY